MNNERDWWGAYTLLWGRIKFVALYLGIHVYTSVQYTHMLEVLQKIARLAIKDIHLFKCLRLGKLRLTIICFTSIVTYIYDKKLLFH